MQVDRSVENSRVCTWSHGPASPLSSWQGFSRRQSSLRTLMIINTMWIPRSANPHLATSLPHLQTTLANSALKTKYSWAYAWSVELSLSGKCITTEMIVLYSEVIFAHCISCFMHGSSPIYRDSPSPYPLSSHHYSQTNPSFLSGGLLPIGRPVARASKMPRHRPRTVRSNRECALKDYL